MSDRYPFILLAILVCCGPWLTYADCNNDIIPDAPDDRYIDHLDGTVSDTGTGLMWTKCPGGLTGNDCSVGTEQFYTWQGGLLAAKTLNANGGFAGYSDWRVPNINELASLVEHQCYLPAINLNVFPATAPQAKFWSSSKSPNQQLWILDFRLGGITTVSNDLSQLSVRLVRGGP
jgi:Protein of unknown function (DUF1566)